MLQEHYISRRAFAKTPETTHGESCVLPRFLSHLHLPKPALQIHTGEDAGTHHGFHYLMHPRQGMGILFSCRKSIQNLKVPSFFHTNTTALHQGEVDDQIAPPSSISCKCWHTSSIKGGAILWNLSLKGSLFVNLMTCLVVSVHPISFFSNEKTL